jgi:selenocysteine-specific elongation factor
VGDGSKPPLCLGTAGHVDHGKTWLVRALTGKDTDRLPEEKARGISIDLGYAPLDLPGGRRLSVVDVPGHERFVRTMVAGATGIDLFLLVIDAAERARAQTHEHLAIIRLLGIDHGVVAVTKADAVEAETLELALEEARELVPGASVVAVSAKTGEALDELRAALARAADTLQQSVATEAEEPARLFVDRAFTLRGIGTVATGTLWSGSIGPGDELRVVPAGLDVRVRSVQVHDQPVERAEAGQRVAVSLPGVERHALRRGDALVEPGAFPTSYRLDVVLEELSPIRHGLRVRVHHGTVEIGARVVRVGERFAQLRLSSPAVAALGDRVVLRTQTTLGGGRVLDPAPPRHSDAVRLERLEQGDVAATIHEPVRTSPRPRDSPAPVAVKAEAVAQIEHALASAGTAGLRIEDRRLAAYLEAEGKLVRLGGGFAIAPRVYEEARRALIAEAARGGSITLARYRDLLGISRRPAQLLLERFDADRLTRRVGDERVLRKTALKG